MPVARRGLSLAAVIALGGGALIAAPLAASADPAPGVVVNEIVSTGTDRDAIELTNTGAGPVDLSGWVVKDDDDARTDTLAEGTVLEPGGYLVLEADVHFSFGLGNGDAARIFDAAGTLVDAHTYPSHGSPSWARCPDGSGDFALPTSLTLGAANDCEPPPPTPGTAVLNEIDSAPADWVELTNPGETAVDLTGYELRDNSDDHRWALPAGTVLEPGAYLVLDDSDFGAVMGLGGADSVRLFDADGALVQEASWTEHAHLDGDEAAATLVRCPDGVGAFTVAFTTPGSANVCPVPTVAINEVESNGDTTDWVEVVNTGTDAVDVSGWTVMDDDPVGHGADVTPLPAGTVLEPGEFFVFAGDRDFGFGLGKADRVTLREASGTTVAEYVWEDHAATTFGRCPDGVGEFVLQGASTKGAPNDCGSPVRLNEIESSDAEAGDWVELVNPTAAAVDLGGLVLQDSDDSHSYTIPAGATLAAGGYHVVEEADLGFGLGGEDAVRLVDADGETVVDEHAWTAHASATYGRCPDGVGTMTQTDEPTKGAANLCPGEARVLPWLGGQTTRVLDAEPMFGGDSSGLDFQWDGDSGVLWAIDNGTGTLVKLDVDATGAVVPASGWEDGRRVRYAKDAGDPAAAGPDTEGVTVAGDGTLYVAAERDNADKGTNWNVVLRVDPAVAGTDLVAVAQWDLTGSLPDVSANTGIEAVEWVPDTALAGLLVDAGTGEPYDPADHPGHGDGLFFVAVEDNGGVYAYALGEDGSATQVAAIDPQLGGVMGLDHDTVRGVLWAMCDDGCDGMHAQITLNGTGTPDVVHVEPPATLPNLNHEGFATATADLCVAGVRPAWWFADGEEPAALRTGTLPCDELPTDEPTDGPTTGPTDEPTDGPTAGPTDGASDGPPDDGAPGSTPTGGSGAGGDDDGLARTGAGGVLAATGLATLLMLAGGLAVRRPTA
ncbi:lamin tail domain-containing protein [Georgenia wangjunii]|uniref:lamin tail domain-containing protein n=1 Tax=Georgenia wangjunii TaxID=3117730 RepID=UPI002F263255